MVLIYRILVRLSLVWLLGFGPLLVSQVQAAVVAITQIVEHPSADKTREGVLKALEDQGFRKGENLEIIYDNAQGNLGMAIQIAKKFLSLKPDVIVAITTPSAQTVVSATKSSTIPVVFAAVTDPLHAKIINNLEHPGGNVTGATDAPPLKLQADWIRHYCPQASTVGIIYCPGEINVVHTLELFKTYAQTVGLKVVTAPALKTSEVAIAAQSLVGKVDAYYVALDNVVLSAMEPLLKIAAQHRIPVFTSDPDSVEQGALASVSYTQYDAGYLAGQMAAEIIYGKKAGDMAVRTPTTPQWSFNKKTAQALGFKVPESIDSHPEARIVTYPSTNL